MKKFQFTAKLYVYKGKNISLFLPKKKREKNKKKGRKIAWDDFQLFMAIEHKHIPYQLQYNDNDAR